MNSFLLKVLFKAGVPYEEASTICSFFGNTFITIIESYNSISSGTSHISFQFKPDFTGEIDYDHSSKDFRISLHSSVNLNHGAVFYADNKKIRFTILKEDGLFLVRGKQNDQKLRTYHYSMKELDGLRPVSEKYDDIISINKEIINHPKYIFDSLEINPKRGSSIINNKDSLIPYLINCGWIYDSFIRKSKR